MKYLCYYSVLFLLPFVVDLVCSKYNRVYCSVFYVSCSILVYICTHSIYHLDVLNNGLAAIPVLTTVCIIICNNMLLVCTDVCLKSLASHIGLLSYC